MLDYARTPDGLISRMLEREGCPVHYWVGGAEGRSWVVLMHGATHDHRTFNLQIPALIGEYRLLVWDCRGHGRSQPIGAGFSIEMAAADLTAILAREGISQAVIVGHSMGGMIAQRFTYDLPAAVRALIILDSAPIAKAYSRLEVWATKSSVPMFRLWPYNNLRRLTANTAVLNPVARQYGYEVMGLIPRSTFIQIWAGVAEGVSTTGLPGARLAVPMLLLHGDRDRNGTIARDAKGWAASEPDCEYTIVPQAAHNAHQDNPTFVNAAILNFLRRRAG